MTWKNSGFERDSNPRPLRYTTEFRQVKAWLLGTDHSKVRIGIERKDKLVNAILSKWRRGPFLEGPNKFLYLERRSKISNLLITKLFYSLFLFDHKFPSYKTF